MAGRSALVVVVPEVESAVSDLRERLDPMAPLGVPAHVTVLFPFMPAAQIDHDVRAVIEDAVRGVSCFDHMFTSTEWFGQDVLWLASTADAEFRALTRSLAEAFPEYLPYAGQHDDVVPHLTIADRAPVGEMRAAERSVQAALPIHATVHAVTLLVEQPLGEWEAAESFPLAADHRHQGDVPEASEGSVRRERSRQLRAALSSAPADEEYIRQARDWQSDVWS